ncbi:hypothetical protein RA274_28215, partial [Pseudomonas syringae pv. tagetis]|uniref:hypothetical protein n=1 Tax=Pseudomonas syringae group genomosp. 7 TaxID=251699 RepID=UPI00376FE1DE
GSAPNAIDNTGYLAGTMRCLDADVWEEAGALPAAICPHTTETAERTSIRRESTAGTFTAIWDRAKTMSSVRWGREVCPPRPVR